MADFGFSDSFDANPSSPWVQIAKRGQANDSGIYSYSDPSTNSSYYYDPKSGATKRTYGGDPENDWANYLKRKGGQPSQGSNNNSSNNNSSNSLLDTGGYLGTGVSFDDYVKKMKELTDWRLGIDKRSMENAYGFRNQEATRDYGFQTGLAGQQIQGQKDIQGQQIEGTKNLETLRNEYMNKRQSEQLANQRTMQESGFSQQNKLLTDNANRAKSLYFGGR